jgi:hypothetical protein
MNKSNTLPQIYAYISYKYLRDDECSYRIKTDLKAFITRCGSGDDAIQTPLQADGVGLTAIKLNKRSGEVADFSISFNIIRPISEDIFIYIANKIKAYFSELRGLQEPATDISVFYKEEGVLKYKVLRPFAPILEGRDKIPLRPQFIADEP